MTGTGDLELAERAARGDGPAMAELVNRALPIVRGLASRIAGSLEEGDALAQEAFAAALEHLERYRGNAAFATWVCAIAVRRHADLKRRQSVQERAREHLCPPAPHDPAEVAVARDTAERLWTLVAGLPAAYREALIARATSETTAQAAERLSITPNALRVRLHRARLALRKTILAHYPDWEEDIRYAHG